MSIIELTYQCVAGSINGLSATLARILPSRRAGKLKRFFQSRRGLMERIARDMKHETRPVYWFHASSLGEYQIARSLMKALRNDGDKAVVLTFLSPTGIDAIGGKPSEKTCADYIYPLPVDSRKNAQEFIRITNPRVAVFMVSELWFNYLNELRRRKIPTILVSCLIRNDSRYFRRHGQFHKRMLGNFTRIIAHDLQTLGNLYRLGLGEKSILTGDPLYDNALSIRDTEYRDEIIENFCNGAKQVFVAGSIHYDKDLELTSALINRHPDVKFIVVPHVVTEDGLQLIKRTIGSASVLYSEAKAGTPVADAHVLVIDFIGALSRIYRYGTAAYVGGGFTRLLHSVVEPIVYGIPISFGPRIERKSNPPQMIERGIGAMVCTPDEIDLWWSKVCTSPITLKEIHDNAINFSDQNRGGADKIVGIIKEVAK
ncbi:MAG: 3-deoxy-D-manno-octulosonic acid transferase [Muribaculum sp.]|nr:3-deoxy-D-manno-octulosonic acid transferase [Muribaculum sp.]